MAEDYTDLISKFGSGASKAAPAKQTSEYSDIINKYGSGGYTAERVDDVTIIKPTKLGDPGFKPEMQSQGEAGTGDKRGLKRVLEGVTNLPANISKSVAESFKAGRETFSEGVEDVGRHAPASGVGKMGLGALSMVVSPITGLTKELIEEPIAQATGSRSIGEKAGFVAGAALPVVPSANAVKRAMPRNRAFQTLVETIEPKNIPTVIDELKSNPRLALMDVSPAAKQMAQQLVVTEGKHLNHLSNVVEQRLGSAKGQVQDIFDTTLGQPVNVVERLAKFKADAAKVGSEQINPAITAAKPVDVSEVVKHAQEITKPGIQKIITTDTKLSSPEIKQQLEEALRYITDGKSYRTDAQSLHEIQSMIRREADGMIYGSDQGAKRVGHALMDFRNKLVDAIDKASPIDPVTGKGTYKPALKGYRDEKQIEEAFHVGSDIISNSKKLENRPEFFAAWKKDATPAELEAAKEGARIAIDTQIRTAKNAARAGTDVPMPDFSATKIKELFGEAEANRMIKLLKDEQRIAQTNSDLFRNSQTAMRSAVNSKVALPTKGDVGNALLPPAIVEGANIVMSGLPGAGMAVYGGAKGVTAAKDAVKSKLAAERNFQLSKMVSASDGPLRDQLIKELEAVAYPAKPSLARRASSLAGVIAPP